MRQDAPLKVEDAIAGLEAFYNAYYEEARGYARDPKNGLMGKDTPLLQFFPDAQANTIQNVLTHVRKDLWERCGFEVKETLSDGKKEYNLYNIKPNQSWLKYPSRAQQKVQRDVLVLSRVNELVMRLALIQETEKKVQTLGKKLGEKELTFSHEDPDMSEHGLRGQPADSIFSSHVKPLQNGRDQYSKWVATEGEAFVNELAMVFNNAFDSGEPAKSAFNHLSDPEHFLHKAFKQIGITVNKQSVSAKETLQLEYDNGAALKNLAMPLARTMRLNHNENLAQKMRQAHDDLLSCMGLTSSGQTVSRLESQNALTVVPRVVEFFDEGRKKELRQMVLGRDVNPSEEDEAPEVIEVKAQLAEQLSLRTRENEQAFRELSLLLSDGGVIAQRAALGVLLNTFKYDHAARQSLLNEQAAKQVLDRVPSQDPIQYVCKLAAGWARTNSVSSLSSHSPKATFKKKVFQQINSARTAEDFSKALERLDQGFDVENVTQAQLLDWLSLSDKDRSAEKCEVLAAKIKSITPTEEQEPNEEFKLPGLLETFKPEDWTAAALKDYWGLIDAVSQQHKSLNSGVPKLYVHELKYKVYKRFVKYLDENKLEQQLGALVCDDAVKAFVKPCDNLFHGGHDSWEEYHAFFEFSDDELRPLLGDDDPDEFSKIVEEKIQQAETFKRRALDFSAGSGSKLANLQNSLSNSEPRLCLLNSLIKQWGSGAAEGEEGQHQEDKAKIAALVLKPWHDEGKKTLGIESALEVHKIHKLVIAGRSYSSHTAQQFQAIDFLTEQFKAWDALVKRREAWKTESGPGKSEKRESIKLVLNNLLKRYMAAGGPLPGFKAILETLDKILQPAQSMDSGFSDDMREAIWGENSIKKTRTGTFSFGPAGSEGGHTLKLFKQLHTQVKQAVDREAAVAPAASRFF